MRKIFLCLKIFVFLGRPCIEHVKFLCCTQDHENFKHMFSDLLCMFKIFFVLDFPSCLESAKIL